MGGESVSPKAQRRQKDGSGTNSAVNAFRQWRRSASAGNKSNGGGSNSSALARMSNDPTTVQKLEQFPLALSDATMPDEDLSLKFLALVTINFSHTIKYPVYIQNHIQTIIVFQF